MLLAGAMLLATAGPALAESNVQVDPAQQPKDTSITSLQAKIDSLTQENRQLLQKNAQLREKNTRLGTKNHNLFAENSKLRALTARLRTMYSQTLAKLRAALRRLAGMFGPWRSARASWYGPGFYGGGLAGGGVLRPGMKIFAHRTMRFGTKVQFAYHGHRVIAVCKDRGPYISGRTFDLGPGTARALGFDGVGTVRWRTVR